MMETGEVRRNFSWANHRVYAHQLVSVSRPVFTNFWQRKLSWREKSVRSLDAELTASSSRMLKEPSLAGRQTNHASLKLIENKQCDPIAVRMLLKRWWAL